MKKIKTVFRIAREGDGLALPEVLPETAWVLDGIGVATVKIDGTACMVRDGVLYRRLDRRLADRFVRLFRNGRIAEPEIHMFKPAPTGWEACEDAPDRKTGHWPGWCPVGDRPDGVHHREAFADAGAWLPDGTYELVGPAVSSTRYGRLPDGGFGRLHESRKNRYGLARHELWRHGAIVVEVERSYEGIRAWLAANDHEGLVFHASDGRMAKIRRKDFGLEW